MLLKLPISSTSKSDLASSLFDIQPFPGGDPVSQQPSHLLKIRPEPIRCSCVPGRGNIKYFGWRAIIFVSCDQYVNTLTSMI
jgi:hypothetical protein